MAQIKRYPFNCEKHAHSIEFRINRLWCTIHDMQVGEIPFDEAKYVQMENEHDQLEGLLRTMLDTRDARGICWLTGKEISLAKNAVAWASETRARSCIERGRYDLLQYC